MEEKVTMDDYAAELEASFHKVQEGDILTGTVIGVSETEVTLDLKSYTEGIIVRKITPVILHSPSRMMCSSEKK